MKLFLLTVLVAALSPLPMPSLALDNGLAPTPPMGWMSWERFRCNTDCTNDPANCISEDLFKQQAEELVLKGFAEAGYEYVIIDDCWLASERDEDGNLQPDPARFPSGIPALADYIHSLGLKFGIYEDYGNYTCAGYPGLLGHLENDANTFAEWGVDYIKVDGCYVDIHDMPEGYMEFGSYLNATGRPIVYSCSWPAYWSEETPDYAAIQETCNLWRNYGDIQDSWRSVLDIIDWFGDNQDIFAQYAAPGSWNDPDMLIIGNFALSAEQSKVQMAIWAVLAAPLIMSNDLRDIDPTSVAILTDAAVIAINQDSLGRQGLRVFQDKAKALDIFVKAINPTDGDAESAAVAVMYRGVAGTPVQVAFTPSQLGLDYPGGYVVTEMFGDNGLGAVAADEQIVVSVNPSGVVLLRMDLNVAAARRTAAAGARRPRPHPNAITVIQAPAGARPGVRRGEVEVRDSGRSGWREEGEL